MFIYKITCSIIQCRSQKIERITINDNKAIVDVDSGLDKSLARGAKVLLVDDELDVMQSFKKGLEMEGYTVDGYTDSEWHWLTLGPTHIIS